MSFLGRPTPPLLTCLFVLALGNAVGLPLWFEGQTVPALLTELVALMVVALILYRWWHGR